MTTTANSSSAGTPAPTAAGSAVTGSAPPVYALKPPRRSPLTWNLLWRIVWLGMDLLWYRIQHVLGVFEKEPETVVPITLKRPGGTVSPEMLKICEQLAEASEARLSKLEKKSTGTL